MSEENIKDFTINWVLIGLLTFCLMSFAITFMYYNNPLGLGEDVTNKISSTTNSLQGRLYSVDTKSNSVLNITSQTNPEASELGSRDSVASAFALRDTSSGFFESIKIFLSWVLVGDMGKMLISVVGGILGILSVFYIVRWIRQG